MPLYQPPTQNDRVYIDATRFFAYTGSPVLGTGSSNLRVPFYRFDAAASEGIYAILPEMPTFWNTANMYLWTVACDSVAANNIVVTTLVGIRDTGTLSSAGLTTNVYNSSNAVLAISNTQYTVQRHTLLTGTAHDKTVGPLWQLGLLRVGGDGSDNYAGDIGICAVELVRAT